MVPVVRISGLLVKVKEDIMPNRWLLISLSQAIESVRGYTTEPVVHGHYDGRPTVTFRLKSTATAS